MRRLFLAGLAACLLAISPGASAGEQRSALHHEIDVWLHPETGSLTVDDTITVTDRDGLTLEFADWMAIDDVDTANGTAEIDVGKSSLTVAFSDNGTHELKVRLSGTLPSGAGSRAGAGPDGAFLFGSSGWLPDTGEATLSYRLRVSVPKPFRAVAAGNLTAEKVSEETYSATFESNLAYDRPVIFAGLYEIREKISDGIRLRTYFHQGLSGFAEAYLANSGRYLARFDTAIGTYPFNDFFVVSAPLPVGLGFTNMTYIDRRIVPLPFMQGRSLAHEILHNWWGNGVQVAYREGNWSEGLTTYMADYGLALSDGPDAAREMRLGWLRDYAALPEDEDTPVKDFVAKRHQASQIIGYNKAAYIFHMLEDEIGTAAFSNALREFWAAHQFKIAGWSDLQVSFEAASGQELDWFFDQWLERAGAPTVSIGDVSVARTSDGYVTEVSLVQSAPAYRLNVPVEVETASATRREKIRLAGSQATIRLQTAERPVSVRVDAGFDLFRHLLPGESPPILRDVMLAGDVSVSVLSDDEAFSDAANQLVPRLVSSEAKPAVLTGSELPDGALVVFGTPEQITRVVEANGLDTAPPQIDGATASVWTSRRKGGEPVLLVSARDSDALAALIRPLPHYGRQSFVVFSGRKAVARGIWPTPPGPLNISLDDDAR